MPEQYLWPLVACFSVLLAIGIVGIPYLIIGVLTRGKKTPTFDSDSNSGDYHLSDCIDWRERRIR